MRYMQHIDTHRGLEELTGTEAEVSIACWRHVCLRITDELENIDAAFSPNARGAVHHHSIAASLIIRSTQQLGVSVLMISERSC
jgi:hypothetical protein